MNKKSKNKKCFLNRNQTFKYCFRPKHLFRLGPGPRCHVLALEAHKMGKSVIELNDLY